MALPGSRAERRNRGRAALPRAEPAELERVPTSAGAPGRARPESPRGAGSPSPGVGFSPQASACCGSADPTKTGSMPEAEPRLAVPPGPTSAEPMGLPAAGAGLGAPSRGELAATGRPEDPTPREPLVGTLPRALVASDEPRPASGVSEGLCAAAEEPERPPPARAPGRSRPCGRGSAGPGAWPSGARAGCTGPRTAPTPPGRRAGGVLPATAHRVASPPQCLRYWACIAAGAPSRP